MATGLPLKLWTVDEYEEMIERGILRDDDRVELIRGEIIQMTPIGPKHASCVRRLDDLFHDLLAKSVYISVQSPVRLPDNSEPQPDVALLRRAEGNYEQRHPAAEDIYLLIEVSDTTYNADHDVKIPLYAEAGVLEAWIVNLEGDTIEVYSELVGGVYRKAWVAIRGDILPLPDGLAGAVSVDEVLG
jgi:Uma2 family endonuclease